MNQEDIVLKLGHHDASIDVLRDKQDKLFDKTDELLRVTLTNQGSIKLIHAKLDNGIKGRLEEMCTMFKAASASNGEQHDELVQRIEAIEKTSWVTNMLDTGWKKALAFIVAFIVINSLSNAAFWGYFKSTIFKESPGTIQSLVTKQPVK